MGGTESKPAFAENATTVNTAEENNSLPAASVASSLETEADDPWWWEIEQENLILEQGIPASRLVDATDSAMPTELNNLMKTEQVTQMLTLPNVENNAENHKSPLISKNESVYEDAVENIIAENSEQITETLKSSSSHEQSLEEFKEDLRVKRLARQTAVQDLRDEVASLRSQLSSEQQLTRRLRRGENIDETTLSAEECEGAVALLATTYDADDIDASSRSRHANIELANAQLALQLANADNLSLRTELGVVQKQVGTLKEVISCCKQMLTVKEEQCTQLKDKLTDIENSFGERELKIMSNNLRQEYERQLGNIRQLRQLYEERQRVAAAEHENLQRLISIKKDELNAEQEKSSNLTERNQSLLKEVENANNELATLREECNEHKFEKKALKEEMGAVNTLFSQMVTGFNGKNNLDIDRLTTMLEENRTLLNDMATKEISIAEGATLPKLLFELVEQAAVGKSCSPIPAAAENEVTAIEEAADNGDNDRATNLIALQQEAVPLEEFNDTSNNNPSSNTESLNNPIIQNASKITPCNSTAITSSTTLRLNESEGMDKVASTQEIIGNLPKVWKVLMELLSHHKIERVQFEEQGSGEDCYKSVETPNGPKAELSVSKTYIKLKDLILEKKSLVKETGRLKTLNCHLEYRLNEQEKRLSAVSLELTKTWHLVGKMQRQHRQLHTQEQILRYQLQQKRRLLSELKEELEYCRRKWAVVRAKNDESQEQYNDLRREFARRKLEDANNSAESGYSDSGPPSDEEERNAAAARLSEASEKTSSYRRKHLKEMFEHTRKIKRMQSTSPGRAAAANAAINQAEVVLRWNSAPPTCGWRKTEHAYTSSKGAIPKTICHVSRSKDRYTKSAKALEQNLLEQEAVVDSLQREDRAERIQRLEEQCKSLIQQVLETSDNREKLEIQLCRFQDEIAPVQYAVPLDEFIDRKRFDRMTRASSAPAPGSLTPREEEYTRKRSERLERLEEESRQLMSRIKRTSDRGHYLRCSLDRIRRAPSRDDSVESNTEEESIKSIHEETSCSADMPSGSVSASQEEACTTSRSERLQRMEHESKHRLSNACSADLPTGSLNVNENSPLTSQEEAYTARRSARLQRLENESKLLLSSLSRNAQRGNQLENKLDTLHDQHGDQQTSTNTASSSGSSTSETSSKALGSTIEQRLEDIEKISSNRQERLRLLEEEGKQLISKLSNTSQKGTDMIKRMAERERERQARTDAAEASAEPSTATPEEAACSSASLLLPTPKNVACSSIVGEELKERVTVTTTPSCIATLQGAIPKTKPESQLNAAARQRETATKKQQTKETKVNSSEGGESLEDMVRRLREVPFPEEVIPSTEQSEPTATQNENTSTEMQDTTSANETQE